MAFAVAPRNTTTAATGSVSATTVTATFTVVATVLGDVCVAAFQVANQSGRTLTYTPPDASWVKVLDSSGGASSYGFVIFVSNKVPAGTTSLAFKLVQSGAAGNIELTGIYACWPGGSGPAVSETNQNSSIVSTTAGGAVASIALTGSNVYAGDLVLWVGGTTSGQFTIPTNPTGAGTWTSVNTKQGPDFGAFRLSAQVIPTAAGATASGSTATSSSGITVIQGIVSITPTQGKFFALMN